MRRAPGGPGRRRQGRRSIWPRASPIPSRPRAGGVGQWSGERGHYVGHSLVQRTTHAWWCALETDHEVFIDGEYALLGTGLEDHYSAGFYWMLGPVSWALAGASGCVRDSADGMDAIHMFRHHLVDAIPFEDELRFEIESYIGETTFTGCSFFYVEP